MTLELYPHNQKTYEYMKKLFQTHHRVAAVQPTGTGKSFLYLKWIEEHPVQMVMVISPSQYIFRQLEQYQEKLGQLFSNVCYYTYAKLSKMTVEEIARLKVNFIVLDEFHRCGAPEWGKGISQLLELKKDSKVFGTSATPIRYLDSCRDMAQEVFQDVYAVNMSIAEAMEQKILPTPIYVASYYSFLGELEALEARVHYTNNEKLKLQLYNKVKQAKRMLIERDCTLQGIFKKHLHGNDGKYIVFCSSEERLQEAMDTCESWFTDVVGTVHKYKVLSTYKDSKVDFQAFEQDDVADAIKLLFCVDMLNEGIHVEKIDGVMMLRTTESLNVYYQQLGRALTCVTKSKKRPVIFDLVNNFENGNAGQLGSSIFTQFFNEINDGDFDIDFELHDYILDLQQTLEDIRNTFDQNWDYNYESVRTFLEENHRFPYNRERYHGIDLGSWCIVQRRQYQKRVLSLERVRQLDEIGFVWNPRDDGWNVRFEELKMFVMEHQRFPKSTENASLHVWIDKQKKVYEEGNLTEERKNHLTELGMDLTRYSTEDIWEQRCGMLAQFQRDYGRLPKCDECVGDIKLGAWLVEQRSQETGGTLVAKRKVQLEAVGVVFQTRKERAFDERFVLLQAFLDEYQRFPNTTDQYQGFGLGVWCSRVREDYKVGNLNEEQIRQLQGLSFDLRTTKEIQQEEAWNQYYIEAKEFLNENGRLPRGRENQRLYRWIKKQKQVQGSGLLTREQYCRFQEIEMR